MKMFELHNLKAWLETGFSHRLKLPPNEIRIYCKGTMSNLQWRKQKRYRLHQVTNVNNINNEANGCSEPPDKLYHLVNVMTEIFKLNIFWEYTWQSKWETLSNPAWLNVPRWMYNNERLSKTGELPHTGEAQWKAVWGAADSEIEPECECEWSFRTNCLILMATSWLQRLIASLKE